jgi:hypothetical protein
MRTSLLVIAATLSAGTMLLAQGQGNGGNGKANGRGDRLIGMATPSQNAGSGITPLLYNGGPVMTGQTHIYYIYYGNWSVDPNASTILSSFANNLTGSGYYNIMTQYTQSPNGSVANSVSLGGSVTSTYKAANPLALSDSDIFGIVQAAISNASLPLDANGVYFVLTAPGVAETTGFLSSYCGWHTAGMMNSTWVKYSFVGDAGSSSGCSVQGSSSPNNDPPVDAMISVIAHELSETVTDPIINAWYDTAGQEIGDKCAWTFGTTFAAPNGSSANITLGGFDFLIQQEFSNASDSCVMSYLSSPDYSLSVSPSAQSVTQGGTTGNYTVSVNATNGFSSAVTLSVSGLPAGATLSGPSQNPTSTSATFSISTGTAAAGNYTLTITGVSGSLTHTATATLSIAAAPVPNYTLSVTSSNASAQGSTTPTYTITVNPTNGFTGMVNFTVSGLPAGSSLSPAPASSASTSGFAVAIGTSVTAGTYPLTITGTSGSLTHTASASLVVSSAVTGAFTVTVSPSSQTVKRQQSVSYTVTVSSSGGFSSAVKLSVSGMPSHAGASFSPSSITGSGTATLTISTAHNTSIGTVTLTIKGTSGTQTSSGTGSLTVTN